MPGYALTHSGFAGRKAEPLSRRTILALVGAIIGGVALCPYFCERAQFPNIQRYTFGDRPSQPPRIGAALLADFGVIAGYVLVLGACAFITSRLAVSRLGVLFGRSTRWAVFVTAAADLLKDLGLYLGTLLHSDPNTGFDGFLTVATAAMATITTCSLVMALMAVPGAFVVVLLRAFERWQLRPNRQGPRWWNDCGAEQPPTSHRPGQAPHRHESHRAHRRPRHPSPRPQHRTTHPQTRLRPQPRLPTTWRQMRKQPRKQAIGVNHVSRHLSTMSRDTTIVGLTGFEPATT